MVGKISLREAVKHFDVSRPTLQKALKSGKISGVQDGKGVWTIDPSELARVYHPRTREQAKLDHTEQPNLTTQNNDLDQEVNVLRSKLEDAEKRVAIAEALANERAKHIEDLRRLLPMPEKPRHRWWPWSKN